MIEVSSGGITQKQEIVAGGRYLSSDEPTRTFAALGKSEVTVHWRNGTVSKFAGIEGSKAIEVSEPEGRPERRARNDAPYQLSCLRGDHTALAGKIEEARRMVRGQRNQPNPMAGEDDFVSHSSIQSPAGWTGAANPAPTA